MSGSTGPALGRQRVTPVSYIRRYDSSTVLIRTRIELPNLPGDKVITSRIGN